MAGPSRTRALSQWASAGLPYSEPQLGLYTAVPAGLSYNESRTAVAVGPPQAVGPSWALRLQASAWLSNGWFQPAPTGPSIDSHRPDFHTAGPRPG